MASTDRDPKRVTSEHLLDLLLDALQEREAERRLVPEGAEPRRRRGKPRTAPESAAQETEARLVEAPANAQPVEPGPGEEGWTPPPKLPTLHLDRVLLRFVALVAVLLIAVNVPVNRYGVSLARILPDSASLVIRDGLVLKGSGPGIYMLQGDQLRWVSSMDAFEHLDLAWQDVHVVEDSFLARFEQGPPIHVLLKCEGSPHIYRLENQQKRWIRDIETLLAEGHTWEDVRVVSCERLRSIPDGPPIPSDAGPPPQP
jgi:hypothetical protein